ncbi:MAG: carbohydrate ABC transporter permease [bacterium]|nr:carbohydrate ABC transporter permease [Candidatus Sumerlaeota bacterium]
MLIKGKTLKNVNQQTVIWAGALLMLIPLLWMISSSLKTPQGVFETPIRWIPKPVYWENYTKAFQAMPTLLYTRNTIIITACSIIGYLVSGSLVAYSFARLRWPGRDSLFYVLVGTMMLPPQVTIVPLFVIFRNLHWINTYYPLVVPAYLTGWPFFIFLMRQYFLTIPLDLTDAARVDGAGHLRIYWSVILPLAQPALATVAIFAFLLHWNDFFGPLIYLAEDSKFTLALGLMSYAGRHQSEWSVLMAASVVMLLPPLMVFFFCQRYFVEGIALTGTKG